MTLRFSRELISKMLAEAMGTFALVFAGTGSIMIAERFPASVSPSAIPIIFGLVVSSMIYAVGHISGAHFNPAVTVAFAFARHFPKRQVLAYWLAQFLAAIFASFILSIILPAGNTFGETISHVSLYQTFIWEFILTFFLMFVIIAVATDTRAIGTMAGAAIGATVMFCAFLGGPITGASMNPARSFAPALISGHYDMIWLYFIAPILGAMTAAFLYRWIRCENQNETEQTNAKGCC